MENPALPGTPDVNTTLEWIELKQQDEWPKREDTIVKLKHDLSQEQRVWLVRREAAGGDCWVLIKVAKDILLFRGTVGAYYIGRSTRQELIEAADAAWLGGKNFRKELPIELDKPYDAGRRHANIKRAVMGVAQA